jgi:hypothetical protein
MAMNIVGAQGNPPSSCPKAISSSFIATASREDVACAATATSAAMLNPSSLHAPCRLFLAAQRGLAHFQSQAQKYDAASIIISDCNNANVNLAMEQHLFKTAPLRNSHTLMIWRNDPTVVIGKNQNPWAECDLKVSRFEGVMPACVRD